MSAQNINRTQTGNDRKPMLRPTIIVGLGGTGNQVVRRLKRLVLNHYGEKPSLVSFLVIDTDDRTFNDQDWVPLPALEGEERLTLYNEHVPFADVRDNPGAYPEIHEWLSPTLDVKPLDKHAGAGQVRMLGRLTLYRSFDFFARRIKLFFDRCQQIRTQLTAAQNYDFDISADPVIYLVSSVCGGQGAGMFIDAAVALRELAANRFPGLNIVGALTLPSVYESSIPRDNWDRVCANTHAAMKEVDYLMHSPNKSQMRFHFPAPIGRVITPHSPLFDLCYLLDINNPRGALNRPEEVFDQMAVQLFLEIGTPFGARDESVRINLNTIAGIGHDKVYHTGRRYSSFANHTISFDREKIVELAALKSAYALVHDTLLGQSLKTSELEQGVGEFIGRHRLNEEETDDLVNLLITSREVGNEQITSAFSQDRPDHAAFADALWSRFDTFWVRRASDLRAGMEQRARARLDGDGEARGHLADLDAAIDARLRESGAAQSLAFIEALLSRLRSFEALMRAEMDDNRAQAERLRAETETARTALSDLARELARLENPADRIDLFSRVWRKLGFVISVGKWRPGAAEEEIRARQFQELTARAAEQRNLLLTRSNHAVARRLAVESREVAASLYAELVARLLDRKERLARLRHNLEESANSLRDESNRLTLEVKRSPYSNEGTMRRDVTADYVDQYHQTHVTEATEAVLKWLLPPGPLALDALERGYDRDALRRQFHDRYAEDILHGQDRDSLAEMIGRFHSHSHGGSLTDRISEGLRFCLPFWNVRLTGNQYPTEVLMVGLEQDDAGVQSALSSHSYSQLGEVVSHVVPTGQDSVILISRVAHGASYYWHAQSEAFFRQYQAALDEPGFTIHLNADWRRLPEPVPDPTKFERRVYALGLAYELIAVRGAAYYFDSERRYTLAGTARQATPDWETIPLLEASAVTGQAAPTPAPSPDQMLDDDNRTEAMMKFVDADDKVAAVRDKLTEIFNRDGRDRVRSQLERYCREVVEPALARLAPDDKARDQLEVELTELSESIAVLQLPTGKLKLTR